MQKIDFCVIGGGFTGLRSAISYKIIHPTKNVSIITKDRPGSDTTASCINGGHILPGYSLDLHKMIDQIGSSDAFFLYEHSLNAVDELVKRSASNLYVPTLLATDRLEFQNSFEKEICAINQYYGNQDRMIDFGKNRIIDHSQELSCGFVEPHCGIMQPEIFWNSLYKQATSLGINFVFDTISKLIRNKNSVSIKGENRSYQATLSMVAAAENTPHIIGQNDNYKLRKTTSYRFKLQSYAPKTMAGCIETEKPEYYWVHDNELRFGIRSERILTGEEVQAKIKNRLGITVPTPYEIKYGTVVKRPSNMPLVKMEKQIIGVYGFSGQGVALSNYLGDLSGKSLAGDIEATQSLDRISKLFSNFD